MRLKADIERDCVTDARSCKGCTEYDRCDNCGCGVCKYVSVAVNPCTDQADAGELICRVCADEYQTIGYYYGSVKEGAIFCKEEDYERWKREVESPV